MTWVAHLVRTMTGQKGARLELAGGGSWSIPAVGIEDFTVQVSKRQLRGLEAGWWDEMRTSVLVSWDSDAGVTPWLMGPITQPPSEETTSTVTLSCKGLGALLQKRFVLAHDYGAPGELEGNMAHLAASTVRLTGRSLGTIAQDIVKLSTAQKLGGYLPIRYGSPRETGTGLNERTYEGFNLANNQLWKRLMELAEVQGGPDIQFRPGFADESQNMLEWVMVHGTAQQPSIVQDWTMDLDTTSSRSPVASTTVTNDSTELTNRVYWTGAGEGAGTLTAMVQDTARLDEWMPLLESVSSTSDTDNAALVAEHASAALASGAQPLQQISVKIDGSDQRCEIGRWHAGDLANLTLGGDWLTARAGTRPMKIIAAKGTWTSPMVDLEFQEGVTT